jgi:hypothetical protein
MISNEGHPQQVRGAARHQRLREDSERWCVPEKHGNDHSTNKPHTG